MDAYTDCDATELARRVRAGEVSPTELVDQAIGAIESVDPQLNAVVHRMFEKAREQAKGELPDGPFRGVPMVVKDFDGFVKDVPFTAGTRFLDGFVPDHDAEAIARLRRAGLVFLAKTNLPELAIIGTTENEWRGATHNPWNLARTPGGSSGGSAALVAARAVPVAHGGDGGGSLRIPASACGLVGLKTTRGRIPLGPDYGEGWGGYVQWGVLTRSVRDTAALMHVMAGPMPGDPYAAMPLPDDFLEAVKRSPRKLRIGFSTRSIFGKETAPACARATHEAARLLSELGHEVEEAHLPVDRDQLAQAYLVQVGIGISGEIAEMARWTGKTPSSDFFEASTWFLNQVGQAMSGMDLLHARDVVQQAGRTMATWHEQHDLYLGPTLAHPPVLLGSLMLKPAERVGLAALRALPLKPAVRAVLAQLAAHNFEATPNTQLFNQTGQPAISLPLHHSDEGLPIGVQLAGPMDSELLLLQVAAQLEQAAPWIGRRPPVCAV